MLVYCLIAFLLGGLVLYLCVCPQLKRSIKLNEQTAKQNEKIQADNEFLIQESTSLTQKKYELKNQVDNLNCRIDNLQSQHELISAHIRELEAQAKESVNAYEQEALKVAELNIEAALEKMGKEYQEEQEKYQNEYLASLREAALELSKRLKEKKELLSSLECKLFELQSAVSASVEEMKRAAASEAQRDYYRLNLSEEDVVEIRRLREVLPYLRDKEPLNKVIYKVYYEKPYTDLIGRVIGKDAKTGIYKITNTLNGMCYIGQAANVSERWRQHIKRGVGAEAPTRNKLYPAMLENGVENFTFELIEECSRSDLDAREDFWQEFYHARDYGYSIK